LKKKTTIYQINAYFCKGTRDYAVLDGKDCSAKYKKETRFFKISGLIKTDYED